MNTRRVDDYVKRLRRREEFLQERIDEADDSKSHYDRAELVALSWAIRYIEATPLEAAEHQEKWFNKEYKDD